MRCCIINLPFLSSLTEIKNTNNTLPLFTNHCAEVKYILTSPVDILLDENLLRLINFFYIEIKLKYKVQILERFKKGFYISKAGERLQD